MTKANSDASFVRMRLVPDAEYERIQAKRVREYDPKISQVVHDLETSESVIRPRQSSSSFHKRKRTTSLRPRKPKTHRPHEPKEKHSKSTLSISEQVMRYQHAMERVRDQMKKTPGSSKPALGAVESTKTSAAVPTPPPPAEADEPVVGHDIPSQLDAATIEALNTAVGALPQHAHTVAGKLVAWIKRNMQPNELTFDANSRLIIDEVPIHNSHAIDIFAKMFVKSRRPYPAGFHEFLSILRKNNVPNSFLGGAQQVGRGYPPGKLPIVLRVYRDV